jgi:putative ABC transport system permease protein
MLRATIRSLLARKLRLLLASFAVLLGISFVSGAFVLTDSLSRVFDNVFGDASAGTSVVVQGTKPFNDSSNDEREPVPNAVLDTVRKVPGVESAVGSIGDPGATLILPNGKTLSVNGPPTIGTAYQAGSSAEPLRIIAGKAPVGLSQVAITGNTMKDKHLKLGDTVGVIGTGEEQTATIVGVTRFGATNSLAGATLLAFDPPSAQQLFGTPGTWTTIKVVAQPGVSDSDLRTRVEKALPTKVEAVTGKTYGEQQADDIQRGLRFFNIFLQVFAGIALFVGMFLIFNTFSMLVAQRARELALMRALGASRGQVLRSVLLESVVVGLVSSLGGFGLGILLAEGFRSLMNAFGLGIPQGATVIELRTLVVCLVVGVTVTVVAAMVPARRASRVAPVQALRESGPAEERSLVRRTTVGAVITLLGVLALVGGLSQESLPLLGLGAVLSFVGVTVISPLFARPVVGALASPFARLGISGVLGRGNAMRSPRRTSTTAAALMIGLALVAAISTLGSSAKKSVVKTVNDTLGADYVLHTSQYTEFSPAPAEALEKQKDLADIAVFRQAQAEVSVKGEKKGKEYLQGVQPDALAAVLKLDVMKGSLAGMEQGGIALSRATARSLDVTVGDTLTLNWAKTGQQQSRVAAVYDNNQFAGGYLVSDGTFDKNVTNRKVVVIALKAAPGASVDSVRGSIETALKDYPNVKVEDQQEFVKKQGQQIDTFLNVLTGLLVLSVIIAMLGIINTLALSVIERTRELGLLRAVGLQRKQLKRMIRVESVVTALFGALLGVVVGVVFGYAFVTTLHDEGVTEFAVPWARILEVLVIAALGGVLAAALPARRAARLKVLDAIAAE